MCKNINSILGTLFRNKVAKVNYAEYSLKPIVYEKLKCEQNLLKMDRSNEDF